MSLTFKEEKQDRRVEELRLKEAEELAATLANRYHLPYLDLTRVPINTDALRLVPEKEARAAALAPFRLIGRKIDVAILSIQNQKTKEIISDITNKGFSVSTYLVSETSLRHAWDRYQDISRAEKTKVGVIDISNDHINTFLKELKTVSDVKQSVDAQNAAVASGGGISSLLELLLAGALVAQASDIHIEPEEKDVRLRYRLDGVLQDITHLPFVHYRQIVSRIKLISGMKLNIKQSAQDGRFSIRASDLEIEVRSSALPGAYGESIVLRVLNPKTLDLTFEYLGVEKTLLDVFLREISKPNGMVLLTGPTGSGKTTTLYAFLRKINVSGTKIITIEDPIEYHLKGINQTQTNAQKGYSFLTGLRAALRQDPDIIMIGEIRDSETATIAVNSSLTGHLVFSTLHTNNAAGAIPRLIDLGVNPKVISSALNVSIAQRLVRKLCNQCKKQAEPSADELQLIEKVIMVIKKKKPSWDLPKLSRIWRPGGCEHCNQTGYQGREGIFEAILMDEKVAEATIKNPGERDLRIASLSQGILEMREDGILKVLNGSTSLEELGRVIFLYDEVVGL